MYFPSDASGVQDPDARGKIAGCLKCKLMHTFYGAAWAYFLFCGHIFYNPLSGLAVSAPPEQRYSHRTRIFINHLLYLFYQLGYFFPFYVRIY